MAIQELGTVAVLAEKPSVARDIASVLGATSKRGNAYLRRLFVQGARAVLQQSSKQSSGLSAWLKQLTVRTHRNVVCVASANKLARIAWAVLATGQAYRPPAITAVTAA